MISTSFTTETISLDKIIKEIHDPADGALVTFVGQARNNSKDKEVTALEYEIYNSMAEKELESIASKAAARWKISHCRVIHRYGYVPVGEMSIIIAVTSPHRDESFQACRFIIDEIKKKVPVWKKEIYQDGSTWITEGS